MRVLLLMILAVFSLSVSAQTITATGNVKDATGDPIIGASIVEKGNTSNGTITNLDGDFSLKVPANATLIVSYIGMKTQEIAIKGKNKIDVTLSDDTKALDEVVVIGYGTAKRKDITGSVATVSSEVLSAVPVASATEALQGKMAGVQITTTEGSPDAEMKIRVRGGGSITGDNTPLFIVDGFPVESISDIPASDIEDMTVLKDASSTAIYGSRGANGVILVTTKSGKEGKLSVSYNTYYSWKKMAKTLETLSATDYVKWQREYALLRGNESKFTSLFGNWQDADLYENAPTNDWQDQVFGRTGNTFNHSLTISGGSDKTKFNMGYAHMNDKAIMLGSSFRRDNLSLKLNHKVNDKVSLDFSMRYANTTVNGAGANESKSEVSSADSRMKNVMIYPMFNFPDLSDSYDPDFQLTNPITSVYDTDRKQNRQTFNMNGSFSWEIFKNFKFKTEFGLDWYYNTDKKYYGPSTYNARTNSSDTEGVHPMAYFADTQRKTFRNTNTVNYNFKDIIKNKDHNLNVLVGEETINKKSSLNDDRLSFFPVSFTASQAWALSSQGTPYSVDKYTNADDNLLSYFGRVNLSYLDRYILNMTMRTDGSSRFAPSDRYGYFPSVSLGWNVSKEPFWKFDRTDLKFRLSYGKTGNQDGIGNYAWQPLMSGGINYGNNSGMAVTSMGNNTLTWETADQYDFGFDLGFWNGKLNMIADVYLKNTNNLLYSMPLHGTSGFTSVTSNIGSMRNYGVEFSINGHMNLGKVNWTSSFNISHNKNKLTKLLGDDLLPIGANRALKVGEELGAFYLFKMDGIYQYDGEVPQPLYDLGVRAGDVKYHDVDNNGIINDSDRQLVGSSNPDFFGGWNNTFKYKGFQLDVFFTYMYGNDVYAEWAVTATRPGYRMAITEDAAKNRWTAPGSSNKYPRAVNTLCGHNSKNSTRFLEDGSFIRLRSLTFSYTFPQVMLQKIRMKGLRLYVQGDNLLLFSKYSGWDPEVSKNMDPQYFGVDLYGVPPSRSVNFGINLSF